MAPKTPKTVPVNPADPEWIRIPASSKLLNFLGRLGARSDRGGSPWSRSNMLRGQLDLLVAVVDESDPRLTRDFPQEYYDLTLELLTEPWSLNAQMIKKLTVYVQALNLEELLEQHGIDQEPYLQALEKLTFAERLHLVEAAQAHHAPRPVPGSPDL